MTTRMPLLAVLLLAACSTATPVATAPVPALNPPALPAGQAVPTPLPPFVAVGAVHWWRSSAERMAIYQQTYRWAGEQLRQAARAEARGSWGVIMDADETVLDNSTYQLRRNGQNLGYTSESWAAWVAERAAPATPGAVAFTRLVHDLGGRVAIVTNRDDPQCDDTRANLQRVGVAYDVVLCRVNRVSDKNPRFQAVQSGTGTGLPALKVLMWVGDNIQDFPSLGQSARDQPAALAEFGSRFVVLPNPMYGSWEGVGMN